MPNPIAAAVPFAPMARWAALVAVAVAIGVWAASRKEDQIERQRAADVAQRAPIDVASAPDAGVDATSVDAEPVADAREPLRLTYKLDSFTALRDPGDPRNSPRLYHGLSVKKRVAIEKEAVAYVFRICSQYPGWERVTRASAQFNSPGDGVHYDAPNQLGDIVQVGFTFGEFGQPGSEDLNYKIDVDGDGEPFGLPEPDGNMDRGENGDRARIMCSE